MGMSHLPSWWMRYPYQQTDMEKNALRAATATRTVQNVWVHAAKMADYNMNPDDPHQYIEFEGVSWVLWKTVEPDPNGTGAGLPGKRFPWER